VIWFLRIFSVVMTLGGALAASADSHVPRWVSVPLFAIIYVLAGGLSLWVHK
jgi:hypothetical protein